jgi:N-acetylneuraminate 9-O-acetyltransferase
MFSVAETAPLTTMASAMFFGTVTFTTVALATKSALSGDVRPIQASYNPRATALDLESFTSIYILLHHVSVLGVLLLYAYLCEYHPPFPHSEKSYDRDEFFFLTALLLVVSVFTLKKNDSSTKEPSDKQTPNSGAHAWQERQVAPVNDATEVLNRDQTEEWKGWMQFMFLLYHYFQAEEVYNAIRIMITCYVWMTGFGNFSFFYLKGDYSSVRVLQMLWRLNFLVFFLILTQGTTYILYYICLLHTYFFLMVYVTMRVAKHVNYSKWGIRIKLAILALVIYFIWDVDTGIFQAIHWPFLGDRPMIGATSGAMWEWYFRSSLDHWSTFLGMLFALNFPITSLFFRKIEAQAFVYHVAAKAAMGAVLLAATFAWVTGPFQLGKFEYNQTNSYFGVVPVLTYIYFRNLTPWLRSHTLDLLHQIGKTTLETYLMQHHIWLTSNAKSLLTLIPGWPKMNFLVVTIIYFYTSRRLYHLTLFLRGMVLPDNRNACIRHLVGISALIGCFLVIASILKFFGMLNLLAVAVCSVGLGLLLYQVILLRTWSSFSNATENVRAGSTGFIHRAASPTVGALAVIVVGIAWHHMAETGAGPIQLLPPSCEEAVLRGSWVPFDGCNANSRGASYRDYGIASMGTCSAYAWGWEASPSSKHCRFAHRDPKNLRKALKHRNVTFAGDSVVRHLYHAACRQLGDDAAGSYNTSMEKWSDFSRQYGTAAMEFRWAPYVANLTTVVGQILRDENPPDLVVIGGGAWDRLHKYNTEQEQEIMHEAISTLAKKLDRLRTTIPVTWVVPTMINSWALTSDQKRENIREDQMDEFRLLYRNKGIHEVASFVLNGTAFTIDRVEDSYDGVHYPLSVYDGGAQILANAMDWLLLERDDDEPIAVPRPGSMDNPYFGLVMLGFVFVSLFYLDGFMGVSYIAAFFVPSVSPRTLKDEAFESLHQRMGLPAVHSAAASLSALQHVSDVRKNSDRDSDDEMDGLLVDTPNELCLRMI